MTGRRSPSPHARLEVASGDRHDLRRLAARNHRRLTVPTRVHPWRKLNLLGSHEGRSHFSMSGNEDGDEMDLQKLQPSSVTGSRSELIPCREVTGE